MHKEEPKMGVWFYGSSLYSFWLQAGDVQVSSYEGPESLLHKDCWEKCQQSQLSKLSKLPRFLRLFQYYGQEYFCYLFLKCLLIILKSEDAGKTFETVFQRSFPKNNYYQRLDFSFWGACYQSYFFHVEQ